MPTRINVPHINKHKVSFFVVFVTDNILKSVTSRISVYVYDTSVHQITKFVIFIQSAIFVFKCLFRTPCQNEFKLYVAI
jgi:hypothetical protein